MRSPPILLVLLVGLTPIILISLIAFGASVSLAAWQPPSVWSKEFAVPIPTNLTPTPQTQNIVTALFADSGAVYSGGVLGYPFGVVNSSTGRLFLAQYGLSGQQEWIRQFGDPAVSKIDSVFAGSRGVGVAGFLSGRGFIQFYNLTGTAIWTAQLPSSQSQINDVTMEGSTIYAGGYDYFASNASYVGVLRAYDLTGNILWVKNGIPVPLSISASSNRIYSAGAGTLESYYLNGTLNWSINPDCPNCETTSMTSDGNSLYLAGDLSPIASNNYFLVKYDLSGNKIWTRQFSPYPIGGSPLHASADSSGIYISVPGINGGGFMAKYDAQGNQIWSLSVKPELLAISTSGGSVYVGGATQNLGGNAFLAAYSQSSSLILLGVNPPFSFGIAALIVGTIIVVVWRLRKYYGVRARSDPPGKPLSRSKRIPADAQPGPQS